MDIGSAVPGLLSEHPLVDAVKLTGSRATGTAHGFSDWDFEVETRNFARVAEDLPALVAPLQPLAEQWDRYAPHACFMLILRGPTKVDLLFLDEEQAWAPPWEPTPDNLGAIDRHFWDWILWLEQKRRGGRDDVLAASLDHMHELLLSPMGARVPPATVSEAVAIYLDRRADLEATFGIEVPRELELEVRPALVG
jgi:hypothetical protein